MKPSFFFIFPVSALLQACSGLSGLDALSSFSCKASPGVICESISSVHENVSAGNLPFQRESMTMPKADGRDASEDGGGAFAAYDPVHGKGKLSPRNMAAAYSGHPVRTPVMVLRTWVAPYEDENGDLFDQSYFYIVVHTGKWMVEATRAAISSQFRPIYPLQRPSGEAAGSTATDSPVQ